MSQFSASGLSLLVGDPIIKASRTTAIVNLTKRIDRYSHELRRIGGYYQASLSFSASEEEVNEWIQEGLLRHIDVYSPSGVKVWEGFVNKISASLGGDSFRLGPITDLGNRLSVVYSTIDTSVDPPLLGQRDETASADNATSTAAYGIWQKKKSINGATATTATQLRDSFLNDPTRAFPATSFDLSTASGSEFSISLDLLGYYHWLKAWYYANSATGTANLSTKLTDVLTDDPNSIFSTDYTRITANTLAVPDGHEGNQTAETIIKNLINLGDASDNPYSFGFYAERQAVYEVVPTTVEYQKRRGSQVADVLGTRIDPWDVLPSKWIFRPDFLVGRTPPLTSETLGTDPRAGLIEVVKYSAPYDISISGVKLSQLDQALAKQGIGGLE